jgi:anaerobic ribonucleoside-triphosphate reductase activating protein
MQQAAALTLIIKAVRSKKELGVMCYTGYTYEYLIRSGNAEQKGLLATVDLLIDGPYIAAKHANLRWRGSSNQRLIALTDRYRDTVEAIEGGQDISAGLQFSIDADGSLVYIGVPPVQGFEAEFEWQLQKRGIRLKPSLRQSERT